MSFSSFDCENTLVRLVMLLKVSVKVSSDDCIERYSLHSP